MRLFALTLLCSFPVGATAQNQEEGADSTITTTITRATALKAGPTKGAQSVGKLSPGKQVQVQAQYGSYLQVRFQDGNYGWVHDESLEGSHRVRFTESVPLFKKQPRRGKEEQYKVRRKLGADEHATYLERDILHGYYKVRTSQGEVGYVNSDFVKVDFWERLPGPEHYVPLVIPKSKFDEKLRGQPPAALDDYLGAPDARVLDEDGDGKLYYSKLSIVEDGQRRSGVSFAIDEGRVQSYTTHGGPESFWVDGLPLASWMRTFDFGLAFQKIQDVEILPDFGDGFLWWLLETAIWLVAVVLFFSLPGIFVSYVNLGIGYIRPLPNSVIWALSALVSVAAIYSYYLFVGLHMMHEEHWLLAVIMPIVLIFTIVKSSMRIVYNRCPNCHAFNNISDKGSDIVGKKHKTTRETKYAYRGKSESISGNTVTHHYDQYHVNKKSTEIDYRDHRCCNECGYLWDVERQVTVQGHK